MVLNQSKFSQAVNLSRAGVAKAVKNGALVLDENGKIDSDNGVNKAYIYGDAKKKSAFFRYKKKMESNENPKKTKKTVKKQDAKPPEISEIPVQNEEQLSLETQNLGNSGTVSLGDVAEQKQIVSLKIEQEKYIKHSLDNQIKINKLANRDAIQFVMERFINHFTTSIKRVSSTTLADVSKDVLANGKVENKHFAHFEDGCLEMIHDAKMMVIKDMRNSNI